VWFHNWLHNEHPAQVSKQDCGIANYVINISVHLDLADAVMVGHLGITVDGDQA